jgi:hypothetical protein
MRAFYVYREKGRLCGSNYSRIGFDHDDLSNGRVTMTMVKVRSTVPSGHCGRMGTAFAASEAGLRRDARAVL